MSPPPVLLLHGLATNAARTWGDNGWIDLLGDTGRTVLAPDLMGHGNAPAPHDPEAYADFEDHIRRAIDDAFGDQQLDAVGFSLGSRTLLSLAAAEPGRFRRLVLSGAGANLFAAREEEGYAMLAEAITRDMPPDEPNLSYFQRSVRDNGNDPEAIAAFLRRPPKQLWTDESLAAISGKVLVAIGDRDFAGPADPLVEHLTGADVKVVILKDTDHFATPKSFAFLDAALDFLEGA